MIFKNAKMTALSVLSAFSLTTGFASEHKEEQPPSLNSAPVVTDSELAQSILNDESSHPPLKLLARDFLSFDSLMKFHNDRRSYLGLLPKDILAYIAGQTLMTEVGTPTGLNLELDTLSDDQANQVLSDACRMLPNCRMLENISVSELPQTLCKLTRLQSLHIQNEQLQDASNLSRLVSLVDLRVQSYAIEDIPGIEKLTNLRALDLRDCNIHFNKIAQILPQLPNLKWLGALLFHEDEDNPADMTRNFMRELSNFTQLRALQLYWFNLPQLEFLSNMDHLEVLGLQECTNLQDLNILTPLTRLEVLDISGVGSITDLQFIRPLKNLQEIHVDEDENVSDLEDQEGLDVLRVKYSDLDFEDADRSLPILDHHKKRYTNL